MVEIKVDGQAIRLFARWWTRVALGCVFAFALLWLAWGNAQPVSAEPPWPEPPVGTRTQLPILSFVGADATSQTLIQVQNVGSDFTRAILLLWGEAGACGPQATGPFKVECSGLIKPGATWMFGERQIPGGAKSGIVYTFPQVQILNADGDLVSVADEFCERLFSDVVFDADEFRRFDLAFRQGDDFFGLPTTGGQPVAVDVVRVGQGTPSPDLTVSGAYAGITGPEAGAFDPVFGGFSYYAPIVYADAGGLTSWLYIQNSGLDCTGVELWFQEQGECLRAQIAEIITLAPGETAQYNVSDIVGPSFVGSVWIRTSQPVGVVVDHIGQDILMTDKGVAAPNAAFDSGSEVLFGPLIYREFQGWETSISVQNLSGSQYGMVKVYFYDESGNIITTLVDYICPRGSQTFFLPVINGLPGQYVGAVRVESLTPFLNAGTGDPAFVPIAGVAHLKKYTDPTSAQIQEAISYNLFGESQAFDWQQGPGQAGLIGVPSVLKQGRGLSTELAIQNVNPNPGFTDFAIYLYDANGLLEVVCEKLSSLNVEYINFNSWGIIDPGFVGSVVISGVYTNQPGGYGLTAVAIQRVQSILQFNAPGDESSGHEAFPIFVENFDFEGPTAPQCPGQPAPCTGDAFGTVVAFDYEANEANPEGNEPITGATVAGGGATQVTNGTGNYELRMSPGSHLVTAEGPEVTTENDNLPGGEYTTTAHFARTEPVSVVCFEDTQLNFTLICKALLVVNVLDTSATVQGGDVITLPVEGATVQLTIENVQLDGAFSTGVTGDVDGDGVEHEILEVTCTTDENGQCVLEVPLIGDNVVPGSAPWELVISAEGYDDTTDSGNEFADNFEYESANCLNVLDDQLTVRTKDYVLESFPTIRGVVFCDANGNGGIDAGEGQAGVTVRLATDPDKDGTPDSFVAATFTNLSGTWSFTVSLADTGTNYIVAIGDQSFQVYDLKPDEIRVLDPLNTCP